ncbi:unnamed protein product, partial [Mesorhabditis spiculigera]
MEPGPSHRPDRDETPSPIQQWPTPQRLYSPISDDEDEQMEEDPDFTPERSFRRSTPIRIRGELLYPTIEIPHAQVIADLQWLIFECDKRCMIDEVAWATDVLNHCSDQMMEAYEASDEVSTVVPQHPYEAYPHNRNLMLGRALMHQRKIHRANSFFEKVKDTGEVPRFLYYYSKFMTIAKSALQTELIMFQKSVVHPILEGEPARPEIAEYTELHTRLLKERSLEKIGFKKGKEPPFDIFLEYLTAKVELELDCHEVAWDRLIKIIEQEPRFWPAYDTLVHRCKQDDKLKDVFRRYIQREDRHWLEYFFEVFALAKMNDHHQVLEAAQRLMNSGLANQPFLMQQIAISFHETYANYDACEMFENIRRADPYRLSGMEIYANALYVLGQVAKIRELLVKFEGQRFTWQVAMITANYYSLRSDHIKAIQYFEKSLRLNPSNSRTWTLLGHEYMEIKNHPASALCYRRAGLLNPQDPAPQYGLGTMYDVIKMQSYGHRFFVNAFRLRPYDSRMIIEAKQYFKKAFFNGDPDGLALFFLGKVCEKQKQREEAARAYEKYLKVYEGVADKKCLQHVLLFLANFCLERKKWDAACFYGTMCSDYEEIREEGAKLIEKVQRAKQRESTMWLAKPQTEGNDALLDSSPDPSP